MAAPVAAKTAVQIWQDRDRIVQAILAGIAAFFVLLLIVIGCFAVTAAIAKKAFDWFMGDGDAGQITGSDGEMIRKYWPIYRAASEEYHVNVYLLASIHKQESSFSTGSAPGIHSGVNSYGCCAGPMQFNVANGSLSTWDAYKNAFKSINGERPDKYPLQQATHPSPYDDFDAIAAAAKKLSHDKATQDLYAKGTYDAVCAYIGSCSNVDNCGGPNDYCQVLPRAQEWEKAAKASAQADAPLQGPFVRDDIGTSSVFPVPKAGLVITTRFGETDSVHADPHHGLDLAQPQGTPVFAFHRGKVSLVAPNYAGYGNFVCIDHPDLEVASCYAHLMSGSIRVRLGQAVEPGTRIASVGSTGHSTGPHLHFEIRIETPSPIGMRIVTLCPAQYVGLPFVKACVLPQL